MNAAFQPHATGRGAGLLLAHCAAIADVERRPPRERLEAALGGELAHLLVFALAGAHGRLGSSSP
jgi:hypothetical protein